VRRGVWLAAVNVEVAAGDGSGDEEGSGFDAVGVDTMARAWSLATPGCGWCGAGAFDFAPLAVRRAARSVTRVRGRNFRRRIRFGEGGGHEEIFGAGDGDLVEAIVRAFERPLPSLGASFEVTVVLGDGGAMASRRRMWRSMGGRDGAAPGMQRGRLPVRAMRGRGRESWARMV